jgi:membrane-bound ClpP family serine protease
MRYLWPALIQLLAFAAGIAEIMVVSFGLLAVVCAGLALYSWYYIFANLPRPAAWVFGLADLLLLPFAIKFAFTQLTRSPISHGSSLGAGSGLESMDKELQTYVGQTAVVEAPLRPTGRIRLGADLFEAQAAGDFVDRGASVKVISVTGSRFQVEKL